MALEGLQMPRLLDIDKDSLTDTYGKFVLQPLERGFGVTVGHGLRRVLVSQIQGAAIKSLSVEGVQHEFSMIKGVREDVPEIILNLKEVALRFHGDEDRTLPLGKPGANFVETGQLFQPFPSITLAVCGRPSSVVTWVGDYRHYSFIITGVRSVS